MHQVDRRRLGLVAIVFWTMVAAAAPTLREFDWSQDLGSYAENIERVMYQGENVNDESKIFWYEYVVFPLWEVVRDIELTLVALKCMTAALFFLSLRKRVSNSLDAALVIALLGFAPVISENLHEYLRQGMGIATLLFAVSFSSRLVRWPLIVFAVLQHNVVAVIALFVFVGAYLGRQAFAQPGTVDRSIRSLGLAGLAVASVLSVVGGPLIRALPLGGLAAYLVGDRRNIFAALYLVSYALYLGWRSLADRSAPHVAAYLGMVVVCATYSVTADFGRTLSLVMPLHMAAAMSLSRQRDRVADIAVTFLAGVALWFA